MFNWSTSKGFTLIEILVAISIISIVFGITLTSAIALQKSGRDAMRKSDLRNIQIALQQYYADNQTFPTDANTYAEGYPPALTLSSTTSLKSPDNSKTYLNTIPRDPNQTSLPYVYTALNCANSVCTNYCLYAHLEINSAELHEPPCASVVNYNFEITRP